MVSTRASVRRNLDGIAFRQRSTTKSLVCHSPINEPSLESNVSEHSEGLKQCDENRSTSARKRQRVDSTHMQHSDNDVIINAASAMENITVTSFTEMELTTLRRDLLDWYCLNRRTFPWRTAPRYRGWDHPAAVLQTPTSDSEAGAPYAIWVSEVMSQQTRIEVVISYYERWMREFPTLYSLSEASLDRVYELWAGLGYYRRARFLHEGAQQVIQQHQGKLPKTIKELRRIRGIGPYTAGAIASIAFGLDAPCVDGNVTRVLQRLRFFDRSADAEVEDGKSSEAVNGNEAVRIWKLAEQIVQGTDCAGDINQALMELGATVCKPHSANCVVCPISTICNGRAQVVADGVSDKDLGRNVAVKCNPRRFSERGRLKKARTEAVVALVAWTKIVNQGRERKELDKSDEEDPTKLMVLLIQREGRGLLGGLWEVVNLVCGEYIDDDTNSAVMNGTHQIWDSLNIALDSNISMTRDKVVNVGQVKHIFSHIKQTLSVFAVQVRGLQSDKLDGVTQDGTRFRWIEFGHVKQAAVSSQMCKVITKGLLHVAKPIESM